MRILAIACLALPLMWSGAKASPPPDGPEKDLIARIAQMPPERTIELAAPIAFALTDGADSADDNAEPILVQTMSWWKGIRTGGRAVVLTARGLSAEEREGLEEGPLKRLLQASFPSALAALADAAARRPKALDPKPVVRVGQTGAWQAQLHRGLNEYLRRAQKVVAERERGRTD